MGGRRSRLLSFTKTYKIRVDMDADAKVMFFWKYRGDYPSATLEQAEDAYNEYKDFCIKYRQDNPGVTTSCYEEYLKTKQGKQHTFIGG